MFETVAPGAFRKRSRKVFYETLPISITIHALAIVGAIGATQWNVGFPDHSPRVTAAYAVLTIPDPPPPPPPPAAPRPQVAPPRVPDNQITAPTVIPDLIPQVVPEPPAVEQPVVAPVVEEGGVEGGIEGGIVGGIVAAQVNALGPAPGPVVAEDGRVHINRDAKLPMQSISQDYPMYPEDARMKGIEDALVVRYIIGKDGRVKKVEVIDPPKFQQFAEAATRAISHWRFQPLLENGEKTEVVHELTVYFQLK